MFLPKLSRLKTNEIGHVNYQHPGRNASHYGPSIDRFSSIVIYLGLRAISESPKLWTKYDDSENVLFRAGDFANAAGSPLVRELAALPALSSEVERFQGVCKLSIDDVPDLETFISGGFRYPKPAVSQVTAPQSTSSAVPPVVAKVVPTVIPKVVPPVISKVVPRAVPTPFPAPSPVKAAPAQVPARRPAQPAPVQVPHAGQTGERVSSTLVGIVAAVVLGVIGWAIWGIWEFVNAVH